MEASQCPHITPLKDLALPAFHQKNSYDFFLIIETLQHYQICLDMSEKW
jgi:hypothetical protein